jgi:mannose-6-phosphate isomerase-like protein (cupin superfamily)
MSERLGAGRRPDTARSPRGQRDGSGPPPQPYTPSPRPSYDEPTAIPRSAVTRHVWGDAGSGEVADLIYASTDAIHALVFVLPANGRFCHSEEYRTVFGADEVLHVLSGTMVIANPETGEVHRIASGGRVFFRRDTWHHAFAHGGEPLRVLEMYAPPPSTGTSGAYARTRPYLDRWRYADDEVLLRVPGARPARQTLHVLGDSDIVWRRDLGVLTGIVASTEHLTVHTIEVNPGESAAVHAHGGDELLYVLAGQLWVRGWYGGAAHVFELEQDDACYLPRGCEHEYRNYGATLAEALIGVAPSYLPDEDAQGLP